MFQNMTQESKVLSIIGVITLLIFGVGIYLVSRSSGSTAQPGAPVDAAVLVRENSPQTATASAKVTLVEFADFQCPACAQNAPLVESLISQFPGQLNVVFRHFPLPQHLNARPAAQAAEAAGVQNKFWEMYEILYQKQGEWDTLSNPEEKFVSFAVELGLNKDQFVEDYRSGKFTDKINRDVADGTSIGVNATPTFYLNNQKQSGTPSVEQIKELLK